MKQDQILDDIFQISYFIFSMLLMWYGLPYTNLQFYLLCITQIAQLLEVDL